MSYYLIYPLFYLLGLLPRWLQSGIASVIRFLLYRVVHYRRLIVRENLANAFPNYTAHQRLEIEKRFYTHLAAVFLETITMASISRKEMDRRINFINTTEFEAATQGQNVIAMMAHYGSWEYPSIYSHYTDHEAIYSVYRPLSSRGVDRYYLKCRARLGTIPLPMQDIATKLFAKRHSKKGVIVALIADQAPPRLDDVKWFTFLNQPTQFFRGAEKLARSMSLPVYFTHISQDSKGKFEARFELIYDGVEQIEEFEITSRYAQKLEQMIVARPELWMWSHRRWKRKPLTDE